MKEWALVILRSGTEDTGHARRPLHGGVLLYKIFNLQTIFSMFISSLTIFNQFNILFFPA